MKKHFPFILLLFIVVASFLNLVVQSFKHETVNVVNINTGVDPTLDKQIIVYYFHADIDCVSCADVKAYTLEALELYFNLELECDLVHWQPVNIDTLGNEHYVKDYELTSTAIILAKFNKGKLVRYKALPDVWKLVKNKRVFMTYVKNEVTSMLGAK